MSEIEGRIKLNIPFASDLEVVAMVEAFEHCRWPYARWTHSAHLGVALYYLQQLTFDAALARCRHHIQLYNHTCGDPTGYHETITVLFMKRVARYLGDHPGATLGQSIADLAATCNLQWLLSYYSGDLLWSAAAKGGWVEPDIRPLDF